MKLSSWSNLWNKNSGCRFSSSDHTKNKKATLTGYYVLCVLKEMKD